MKDIRPLLLLLFGTFLHCLLLAGSATGESTPRRGLAHFPLRVLWAWERPEDLRFLKGTDTGVAFLAVTLRLKGSETVIVRRMQPLLVNPGTPLMAVARIETLRGGAVLDSAQGNRVIEEALRIGRLPGVRAVQIDSDAAVSERPFFRSFLGDLRRRLPRNIGLSFTALASWCMGDHWLSGLPVDEVVPMLFEMGPEGPEIKRRLAEGRDFSSPLCQTSLGLSTEEPIARTWPGRRIYLFSPTAWTEKAVREAFQKPRRQPPG